MVRDTLRQRRRHRLSALRGLACESPSTRPRLVQTDRQTDIQTAPNKCKYMGHCIFFKYFHLVGRGGCGGGRKWAMQCICMQCIISYIKGIYEVFQQAVRLLALEPEPTCRAALDALTRFIKGWMGAAARGGS